jgi:prepilin-type N-terminal cleavage/methylation domain-containing protein
MNRTRQKIQAGYTLVELMVATTIVSILGLLVLGFLTDGSAISLRKITRSDLLRETQAALDIANKDIKYASGAATNNVWPDSNAPGAPSNRFSWFSDNDALVLSSPATASSDSYLYADPATYLTYKNNLVYFVTGNKLYRRMIAAVVPSNSATTTCPSGAATPGCPEDLLVAENVSNFGITYLDANNMATTPLNAHSIRLELELSLTTSGQTIVTSYTIQAVFRNG